MSPEPNTENSLFFPCITGNTLETGSLRTACTANTKPVFLQRYFVPSMDSNVSRGFRDLGRSDPASSI
jgi:hypothetical protein